MHLSYVKIRLSEKDVLGIIEEFLNVENLKISKIQINNLVTVSGTFNKVVNINFSITFGIGKVHKDEIVLKIFKIKVGKLRVSISLVQLMIKKLLNDINEIGIEVKDKHVNLNLVKIQTLLPYANFSVKNIILIDGFIEAEGDNIKVDFGKEDKTLGEIKEKKLLPQGINKDLYSGIRKKIKDKIPENFKTLAPYILLVPDFITLIFRLFKDKRISIKTKFFLGFIIAYLVSPIDIIPDFMPVIGSLDDIYIIFYTLEKILKEVPMDVVLENFEGDEDLIINASKGINKVFETLGVDGTRGILINVFNIFKNRKINKNFKKREGK